MYDLTIPLAWKVSTASQDNEIAAPLRVSGNMFDGGAVGANKGEYK